MPEFEDLNAALVECVKAAGGSKVVGHALWPTKGVDAAQRHLLACLNEAKPERLTPDDVLHVARLARAKGCHAYARYVSQDLGYSEPQPTDPKDELVELLPVIRLVQGKPTTSGKRRTVSPRQSVSSKSGEVGAKAYMPGHFTQLMRENNWPPSYRPSFYMERVGRGFRFVEMSR